MTFGRSFVSVLRPRRATDARADVDRNEQQVDLVAVVSHELRTPLAVVLGSIQVLQRMGERLSAPERAELLSRAEAGARRLERVIDHLALVGVPGGNDAPDGPVQPDDAPTDSVARA